MRRHIDHKYDSGASASSSSCREPRHRCRNVMRSPANGHGQVLAGTCHQTKLMMVMMRKSGAAHCTQGQPGAWAFPAAGTPWPALEKCPASPSALAVSHTGPRDQPTVLLSYPTGHSHRTALPSTTLLARWLTSGLLWCHRAEAQGSIFGAGHRGR